MNTLKCARCGFLSPKAPVCLLTGLRIDKNADFCSKNTSTLQHCAICGAILFENNIIIEQKPDETVRAICFDCNNKIGTCALCSHATGCLFETDPSPIPKIIQKQIRQGNFTQIITVKNPERIEKICKANCPCFSEENECNRHFNTCERCESI